MNCGHALLAALVVATAHADKISKNGTCLLQRPQQKTLGKTSLSLLETQVSLKTTEHKAWRERHAKVIRAMNERNETDELGQFIAAQQSSSSHCSSRLMEAKRVLDSLKHQAKQLSTQVDSHEQVLETESGNLEITKSSIQSVNDSLKHQAKQLSTQVDSH